MNILGIDLGTNKAAVTHITGDFSAPKFEPILILPQDAKAGVEDRFLSICSNVIGRLHTISDFGNKKPDLVVVEYPFNIMGNARILVEMFGVIHHYCLSAGYPFMKLEQTRIKKYVTGSGKAEKSDMRMQVFKEYNLDLGEDQADSFWIAHMGMSYLHGTDKKFRQESIDAIKEKAEKNATKGKKGKK